jgi:alkylhydroperoxidase family enzyme
MTWLPVAAAATGERDAVLGLLPEPYALLREALELSWSITDPALLELCRLRMAQLFECRAELSADEREPPSSERERAALAYAEQFLIDQNGITEEQKQELLRHLTERELCNFVQALNVHDGHLRVLTLLDIGPDPRGARWDPPAGAVADTRADEQLPSGGLDLLVALTDPAFWEARTAFGAAMALQTGVDEVTTEVCRLRNAHHQSCRF